MGNYFTIGRQGNLKMLRKCMGVLALLFIVGLSAGFGLTLSPDLTVASASAQSQGKVPGNFAGTLSDSDLWRNLRGGLCGTVTIPDKQAGCLVQSDGDNWRAFKNGPLSTFGGWLLFAVVLILGLFYLVRGKIMVDSGLSGKTIERFNGLERATHWLTASSFVVLALTGLNVLYGRYMLKPILGADAFAALTYYGKFVHNYIAFAFMLGIILMFVLWVRHNIPNLNDLRWLAVGGGLFKKGVHPPSKRFNAGQKLIFWAVVLGGGSLSVSGIALLFPFEISIWAGTFSLLNNLGLTLPTELSALQETQLSLLWHSLVGLIMIAIIIGHIYIGSIGMEGAIDAVGSGQVDINWAREHHSLWVEEVESDGKARQPAE